MVCRLGCVFLFMAFGASLKGETTELSCEKKEAKAPFVALNREGENALPDSGGKERNGYFGPEQQITLSQAWGAALAGNPELGGYEYEVQAMEGAAMQAGILPNPEVEFFVEQFGGSGSRNGFHSAESSLQLSQLLQTAGKRQKNQAAAIRSRDVAQWEYRVKRLDLLAEVSTVFAGVLALQEKQALMQQSVRIAEETCRTMTVCVSAGKAPLLEQTRAEVVLSFVKIEQERVNSSLRATRSRLAAAWGGKSEEFQSVQGEFYRRGRIPDVGEILNRLEENPELARWQAQLKHRQANVELEKAKRSPDVTVIAGLQNFQDEPGTAMMAGFSIPLPLFDRNQGGIAESQARLKQGFLQAQAARIQLETAVEQTYQELLTAEEQVNALEKTVIPGAERAFQSAQEGYAQGKFSSLDVLDAQRTLFEAKGQHVDAVLAWHRAFTELSRLAAIPISDGDFSTDSSPTGEK